MHATPAVLQELEQDLHTAEVAIYYTEGDELKEVFTADPADPNGSVRLELRPQIVVTYSTGDDGQGNLRETAVSIPLERIVAVKVSDYAESGPYPTQPVAQWFRGHKGQLVRFKA